MVFKIDKNKGCYLLKTFCDQHQNHEVTREKYEASKRNKE